MVNFPSFPSAGILNPSAVKKVFDKDSFFQKLKSFIHQIVKKT